jgi:AmmeMemoRadiSam system protein B/AmmeMemoRadiSam system protein A
MNKRPLCPYFANFLTINILGVLILAFVLTVVSCRKEDQVKTAAKGSKDVSSVKASPDSGEKGRVKKMNLVRRPAVAGAFYPSDPVAIKEMISDFFDEAEVPEEESNLLGLVVPHAGYIYSGGVAAYSYKAIKNPDEIETVILLGPSHRAPFRGISVFPGGVYKTPLGNLTIDDETAAELTEADDMIQYVEQAHAVEHSLEVQLPFIQTIFKDVKIVTVIFGIPDNDANEKFAKKVAEISKKKKVLVVASSDFSHYHDYETAKLMDDSGIKSILKMSGSELMHKNYKKESELCGLQPVLMLMNIMNKLGGNNAKLLHYANSGDVSGDKAQVVGYAAIAFYESEAKAKEAEAKEAEADEPDEPQDDELDTEEKKELLKIARDTIYEYVQNKKKLELPSITNVKLLLKNGAFVTIHKRGNLRGCIGNFTSEQPLYKTIIDMAISAATQDPRFPPVVASELDELELEISVLSPLKKIDDINEIQVGKHGIYIIKSFYRGVLLPQVATEYGWDRMTFLEQTCRKAGIGRNDWKNADIYIFSAQVFSEKELKH